MHDTNCQCWKCLSEDARVLADAIDSSRRQHVDAVHGFDCHCIACEQAMALSEHRPSAEVNSDEAALLDMLFDNGWDVSRAVTR